MRLLLTSVLVLVVWNGCAIHGVSSAAVPVPPSTGASTQHGHAETVAAPATSVRLNLVQVGKDEYIMDYFFWNAKSEHKDQHVNSPRQRVPWTKFDMYATRVESLNAYWNNVHHIVVSISYPSGRPGTPTHSNITIWSWLKLTPGVDFGPDAGFLIPPESKVSCNWHFARQFEIKSRSFNDNITPGVRIHLRKSRPERLVGFLSLDFSAGRIPPGKEVVVRDHGARCVVAGNPKARIIGVLLHAHRLAFEMNFHKYSKRRRRHELLGRVNPKWPQLFWPPPSKDVDPHGNEIEPGDILRTQCLYNSTSYKNVVKQGRGIGDEMCVNYLLYSVPYDEPAKDHNFANTTGSPAHRQLQQQQQKKRTTSAKSSATGALPSVMPEGIWCIDGSNTSNKQAMLAEIPPHPYTIQRPPALRLNPDLEALGIAYNRTVYARLITGLRIKNKALAATNNGVASSVQLKRRSSILLQPAGRRHRQ